jgi:hypothetical protein
MWAVNAPHRVCCVSRANNTRLCNGSIAIKSNGADASLCPNCEHQTGLVESGDFVDWCNFRMVDGTYPEQCYQSNNSSPSNDPRGLSDVAPRHITPNFRILDIGKMARF